MTYEHQMAELLNPGNPTFKRLPGDPAKPASEAYFLWSPEAGKELSFDDCKKDNRPSTLIPGIRQGDGVEYKSDTYWTADKDWTKG